MPIGRGIACWLLAALGLVAASPAARSASVASFSPQGEVVRDSAILSQPEPAQLRGRYRYWGCPVFVEGSFGAYRAYYPVLPKGRYTIEYTVRLNNAGTFDMPPTRVEAMYAPEMFGEAPNARMMVVP